MVSLGIRLASLAAACCLGAVQAGAATRYVNAATGVNTTDCSAPASPCKTITFAMAAAAPGNPGDLVSVAPGTYNIALGEIFPILFKAGVQLVATGTPDDTFIDAAGDTVKQGVLRSIGNASALARIEGFTIANGLNAPGAQGAVALGGGVYIDSSSQTFTLERNVFSNNEARGYTSNNTLGEAGGSAAGGGLYIANSMAHVVNNVFSNNVARGDNGFTDVNNPASGNENGGTGEAGAIYFTGTGFVINNTFRTNRALGGNGGGTSTGTGNGGSGRSGAVSAPVDPAPAIVNNIFANNTANSGSGGTPATSTAGAMSAPSSPSITNNLFFANAVNGSASSGDSIGAASVALDPLFQAPPTNLRLRFTSPARGAGTAANAPATDFDGVTRPSPPSIGAFEASGTDVVMTLVSSLNPSQVGQSVTFTMTVTAFGGAEVQGGVTFLDGPNVICFNVALAASVAHCTTSSLTVGNHSISGEYGGDATYAPTTSDSIVQAVLPPPDPPRLFGISARLQVQTGDNVMIGGFIIGGSVPKTVVIRARGPTLGVAGALLDPTLIVVPADGGQALENNDWQTAPNAATLSASGFAPAHPKESAIYATLAPGAYTAIVQGVGGTTGIALVEVYEIDHPEIEVIGISTRGLVQTGDKVMIGGFIVRGIAPQQVVIRARGPSLGVPGALADPTLTLVPAAGGPTTTNNDWQSAANASTLAASGYAPTDSKESAILITLNPGAYTALVTGVGNTTGVAIVEVYEVP